MVALKEAVFRVKDASGADRDSEVRGVLATLGLIKRLSESNHSKALMDAGVLDSLKIIFDNLETDLEDTDFTNILAAACSVLASMCGKEETYAAKANNLGLVGKGLELITATAPVGALEFIAAVSAHESIQPDLMKNGAFDIIAGSLQSHADSVQYQMAAFDVMYHLCSHVDDLSQLVISGGLLGIAASLLNNFSDKLFVAKAFEVVSYLAAVPGADQYAGSCPELVDAICLVMFSNQETAALQTTGMEILETLASESDPARISENLGSFLSNWRKNTDSSLIAIAAAAVISKLTALGEAVESAAFYTPIAQNIADMLKYKDEKFENAGFKTICNPNEPVGMAIYGNAVRALRMVPASGAAYDSVVPVLAGLCANPTLVQYHQEAIGRDPPVLETVKALKTLLAADKVTDTNALKKASEGVIKALNAFSESRVVTLSLSETAGFLIKSRRGVGAEAFLAAGGPGILLSFCKRYQFQPKHLVTGMRNIRYQITCAESSENAAKVFKREGAVPVLMHAIRAAGSDEEVQEESQKVIPLLMDEEEADSIARKCIKNMSDNAKSKSVVAALTETAGAAASPMVGKALARHGVGELAKKILSDLSHLSESDSQTVKKEMATVINLTAASNYMAANKLKQAKLFEDIVGILGDMIDLQDATGVCQALGAGHRVLDGSDEDYAVADSQGLVLSVCKAATNFTDDPSIIKNAGTFLGALAKNENTVGGGIFCRYLYSAPITERSSSQATGFRVDSRSFEEPEIGGEKSSFGSDCRYFGGKRRGTS